LESGKISKNNQENNPRKVSVRTVREESTKLIDEIQKILRQEKITAWLFYDFRGRDPIAHRILGLDPNVHASRRWFYLVPVTGRPQKLVHKIESRQLDSLPGDTIQYSRWNELETGLQSIIGKAETVAMQYSPEAAIPYVSIVDGGTLELVRSTGIRIVSSENLIQYFDSVWTPEQLRQHQSAASKITRIVQDAFLETARLIQANGHTDEFVIQEYILGRFKDSGLVTDYPPIVAVNSNSSNPHYCPTAEDRQNISENDFLLIDLWACEDEQNAVFADITWTCFLGDRAPNRIIEVFNTVVDARDRGVEILRERLGSQKKIEGWEVDDAVRQIIEDRGFGDYILHRTGHNLGLQIHGNGVNFDNFETHDTRQVIPGVACTIEPGVYIGDFGIRSEINVYMSKDGPVVTTPPQRELFYAMKELLPT
jgi:Xaa-Pro dipeptidase